MHLEAYLRSAQAILEEYQGQVPLAAWLKNYFRQHKKFGSRDRKYIADLCYCYFRLGKAFKQVSISDRLLIGQFLCHQQSAFIESLRPEWSTLNTSPLIERITFLTAEGALAIFPHSNSVSSEIDEKPFVLSHLQQPDLFLRVRPGKAKAVISQLAANRIAFEQEGDCLRLPNTTRVDDVLEVDKDAVVQDISSQRVLEPLQPYLTAAQFAAWDCCAASGGKTILLHDAYSKAKLTVSDVRESILVNLKNRLKRAGITAYQSFVADVSSPQFTLQQTFDLIICDAPCSGSGTWGRTPEQLVFFEAGKIDHYATLQKKIALNASRSLKDSGYLLYITCSVFIQENEEVVAYLQQNSDLKMLSQQYFKGYDKKGDTLFAALFTAG